MRSNYITLSIHLHTINLGTRIKATFIFFSLTSLDQNAVSRQAVELVSEGPTAKESWTSTVPLVGQITAKPNPSTQQDHLDNHLAWRIYMEPWKDGGHGALLKTSVKELKIVESAFPLVSNPEAILAMAAWFATLLLVDDLLENMDLDDARQALTDSIRILSGTHVTVSEETNKPVVKVCHVIRSLRMRISQLLGHGSAIAMLRDVKACLEGQMDELRYRSSPCTSLQEYSRIRHRSIGAMPFLTLAALQLAHDSSAKANRFLVSLKELVVSIVFLQNDLVGLEKDLKEDVSMNAFMVMRQSRGSPTIPTSEDLAELAAQHNALVSKALFMYRRNAGQDGSDTYTLAATSIISFIETHLTWARKSRRYDVS
ncbi:hypothetical protein SLS56_001733 [Neofusicoccum ribis]|uniref:Terpene synthase n=1 Tax=Neofusicoccum ribis TaxID=45134 RepID=A0ABR3T720_9PEZI